MVCGAERRRTGRGESLLTSERFTLNSLPGDRSDTNPHTLLLRHHHPVILYTCAIILRLVLLIFMHMLIDSKYGSFQVRLINPCTPHRQYVTSKEDATEFHSLVKIVIMFQYGSVHVHNHIPSFSFFCDHNV